MEACWAHNPEVRRSKLRSAKNTFPCALFCPVSSYRKLSARKHVPLAQRIARWTSNPKVLGSIPRWDEIVLQRGVLPSRHPNNVAHHDTQHVRMAEWSKAPDSRVKPCSLIGGRLETSGPR